MRKIIWSAFLLSAALALVIGCSKQLPTELDVKGSVSRFSTDPSNLLCCDLTIGDLVWNDVNGNGIQEPGEPGIPGVAVVLLDESGDFLAEKLTDGSGHYLFKDLCPGTYQIYVKPPDCEPTKEGGTSDPAKDSNSNPTTVKLDEPDLTIDFGFVCKLPDCGPCKGKVTDLCLKYNGSAAANVLVGKSKKSSLFAGLVQPGETFCFEGREKDGTFGKEIKVFVGGKEIAKIHTSCSQPIGPGLIAGPFEVVSGHSRDGGPLCPLPPVDGGDDLCTTRPRALNLEYTGLDCSASSHAQAEGKVICSGDPGEASPVRIVIGNSSTPGGGKIWFDGAVEIGEPFAMDAANAGEDRLSADSYAFVYVGSTLVQSIKFHTSCSQPLRRGDQFGSLKLLGIVSPTFSADGGDGR